MAKRANPDAVAMRTALRDAEERLFGKVGSPVMLRRFTLLQRVGMGAWGAVYAAYDPKLDRKVALKILRDPSRRGTNGADLLREAKAIARLSHPNVVTVHDVSRYEAEELGSLGDGGDGSEGQGGIFIVMEYIDGVDLAAWFRETRRSWREVVEVFCAAGRGLAAAHAAGIVHRDFKPDNVMVSEGGGVRVLDFGLARANPLPLPGHEHGLRLAEALEEQARPGTLDGLVMGTPAYMSPEQHRAETVDPRSDQFSFSVSLYEALFGELPFKGDSLGELLEAKQRELDFPKRATDLPSWLQRILRRGLSADPGQRFASMEELLRALSRDSHRTRRVLLGAAAGVLMALFGASLAMQGDTTVDACAQHGERLTGVWDETRKAELARAFEGTGQVYASSAVTSVTRALDAYTSTWVRARVAACEQAVLRSNELPSAPEVLENRALCLDRRLEAARELATLCIEHPVDVIEHAVDATVALPPIADCEEGSSAQRRGAAPVGSQRDRVNEISGELVRAQARLDTADYKVGLEIAAEAVSQAREVGHEPTLARALLLRGRFEAQFADAARADESIFDALVLAESSGANETATLALVERAYVVGRLLGDYREADRLLELARAKVSQLELGDLFEARIEHELVFLRRTEGRNAEGLEAARRLLDIRRRLGGDEHPATGDAFMALAEVHYKLRNFGAAAENIAQAQAAWRTSRGPDHPSLSASEQRLGDMAWRTGRYGDAIAHHERAYDIERKARGEDHPDALRKLMGVANVLVVVGRHEEADRLLRKTLAGFEATFGADHPRTAGARLNLGTLLVEAGRLEEAELHLGQALQYLRKAHSEGHPSTPYVLLELGRSRAAEGRNEDAVAYLERALRHWERDLGAQHAKLGWVWRELGKVHFAVGEDAAAARAFEAAMAVHDPSTSDPRHLADISFGLAQAVVAKQPERALKLARDARLVYGKFSHREREAAKLDEWLARHGSPEG
jgi:serine/threonine-protein kinase